MEMKNLEKIMESPHFEDFSQRFAFDMTKNYFI